MLLHIAVTLIFIVGTIWVFNPYMSHQWRSSKERWTTRERSHGHPFYWKIRYGKKSSPYDYDAGCDGICYGGENLANRPRKMQYTVKNVDYIE